MEKIVASLFWALIFAVVVGVVAHFFGLLAGLVTLAAVTGYLLSKIAIQLM